MRIFNIFISILIIFQVSGVQAVEPVNDHQVMLYYEIPFGDSNQQTNQHQFGMRYDRTMQEPRGHTDFSSVTKKPAVVDLQFKHNKSFALKLHGIDYTDRLYIQQADAGGKTSVETEAEVQGDTSETTETAAEEAVTTEGEAEAAEVTETTEETEKKEEKTVVQKKLDSLPFGVVIGVLLGIGILAGVGG